MVYEREARFCAGSSRVLTSLKLQRDCSALKAKRCTERIFNESVGSPQPWHLLKTRTAGSRNLIKFINTNPAAHWKPPLARVGRKGKDGRLPSHPGPGKGWLLSPGVRRKRGPPRLEREARLIFQTSKSQVVSAPRKRPSVRSACGLRGFSAQPRRAMTLLRPAAPAPAPACPARPRRAHADAEDPVPPAPWGAGCRGPAGPRSGRAARQRGAGAQGGARAEQGRPSPQSAARRPPGKGKDADLRVRSADRGPHPAPREAASGSPGCGVHGPIDHLHPGRAGPAASRVPRPGDPGLPRMLCPGPGRGAGGPCGAEGEGSESRGRAARRGPLAGFLHCLNSAQPAPTQGHSRPRSRPRLAAARPSVSLTRSTHPASAPRSGLHTRRRSRLPGFCIRSHARSDTDPVPPPALPSSFPTLLSRRIPYTASALRWLAPHQPPPLSLQTSTSPRNCPL